VYAATSEMRMEDISGISKRYITSPIETQRVDGFDEEPDYFEQIEVSRKSDDDEYDPLKLPANWELAKNHSLAHKTAPDLPKNSSIVCTSD
jgi:hypothetical protein